MTLLGSEHSLLIRSKFRSALKNPAAFHEQRKNLERAKTEDCLKHKIRNRPEKTGLINMHLLQDPAAEGSAQATQMKLKRARLADDLNEKISLRPGPLELVEKNIIPLESGAKEVMKGNQVQFPKPLDAFAFEEDSSNDGLSPEHERGEDLHVFASKSPEGSKSLEATNSPQSVPAQVQAAENEKDLQDMNADPRHSCPLHSESQLSPTMPVTSATVKSKCSNDSKNRHKKPKDIKPKVKKLKYHQYIPPDQKAEKSPPPMDSAYARLLQQQQLFLQLQILSQQQQHQQHFTYPGMHHAQLKQQNDQMVRNCSQSNVNSPSLSPVKTTFHGQPSVPSMKPGLLPSNLDDLKVSELRQQLRIRGLPVSGTKTSLMERLRPFQDCSGPVVPTFGEITTVTFPVNPNNALSNYQTHPSAGVLSNGFYPFGSTSSTPPISPASSDLSVSGSLPDTFSDGTMSSPQFGLHASPIHLSAEESLMSSMNSGSYHAELEGMDAEKDKMLVEKQKVINELTWKLQQEQRQVEELRLQLQKRKGSCGPQDNPLPSQHFFGVPIKQENVSSCPFASKQMAMKAQTNNQSEKLGPCGTQPMSCMVNNHCMEVPGQNNMSSTFLSPQCSPQHSPLGTTNSPQHISLPPSPNNHYLLSVSPSAQGDGRSVSPHVNNRIHTAQGAVNTVCFSPSQNNLQSPFIDQSESKQSNKDGGPPKSPLTQRKMTVLQPPPQTGQKLAIPCPNFPNAAPAATEQPPSYEDAVRQQITRSQQMDELLDVLIESGEMPANAKEDRPCEQQKLNPLNVSTGNTNAQTSSSHLPYDNGPSSDSHLEVLLNSQSPAGRSTEMRLLKLGSGEPPYDAVIDGFPGKAAEEILPSREILDTSLSPMATHLSSTSAESTALHHLSFTESPWETMEWLELTPPSSATGLGSLGTTGPSIFNTDFLDDAELNINTAMDLHLEQWSWTSMASK